MPGSGCAHLYYKHLGGRGRQASELEASLVYLTDFHIEILSQNKIKHGGESSKFYSVVAILSSFYTIL